MCWYTDALCVREGRNWRWNWKKRVTWRSIAKPARLPRLKTRKNVITATEQLETYLESFTEFQKRAAGRNLPWLRRLREDAFARFCEVGFPTTHDEDWRFTNVSAIAEDGAYVHIRKGTIVEDPIFLLFISTASDAPLMSHPRNLIVAEEESQATIVEDYVSVGESTAFCNTITELVAGDSAVISHYMVEREHRQAFNVSTLRIQQGRSANVASHSVLLGGGLVRNNVHPVLAGEGGECLINGLFIGNGQQHLDNYMLVEHASPHCDSRQFYNGILDDRAHGVFHGRIIVHKDAQKTDAKQTNRNLLLSDNAQIDTKPQLEIYADDVKCTHGATIGQIDENALFYLRSRGIDELSARKLLLFAFASECLDRMKPSPAREQVDKLIHSYLLQVANSANTFATGTSSEDSGRTWEEIG